MKKKVFTSLIVFLLIIEGAFLYLTYRSFSNRENGITKVSYNNDEILKSNNILAFYVDDGTGKFQEQTDRTKWPDKNTHSFMKADCYDDKDIKIPTSEVLSFDNVTFTSTITTNKTVYCSLYFASTEDAVGLITKKDSKNQLETVEHMETRTGDTLRRFQGQVTNNGDGTINNDVNNYICFGTNDEGTCTKDTDKYLYRIIGIDTTNDEIKIMKREALNTSQTWTSGSQNWGSSSLQTSLNGTLFLKAHGTYEYMQEGETETYWTKLISSHNWGYGDVPNSSTGFDASTTSTQAYQKEQTAIKSGSNYGTLENTKIGLIYASDYYLAGTANGGVDNLKCHYSASSSDYGKCKKSWMHLSNNDTNQLSTTKASPPSEYEWTMSRSDSSRAWRVLSDGSVRSTSFSGTRSVRPVFYLKSKLKLSGDGTLEHPFMIADTAV